MSEQLWHTPPAVAKRLRVTPEKIISLIHSGEIQAVNVALNKDGKRPRWRISEDAVQAFLQNRASKPPVPRRRRRRKRTTAETETRREFF